uniref:Si:ch211-235m3.5 n=1 Tax=Amphilophus citrinellus TaxID=61819 RepID=A0A3Q0QZ08_AMPCI
MDLEEDFFFHYGAEEMTDYQDPTELLAALKQKEEEVILAAQLGNALLLENRQLKEQSDKLHEQYAEKLEELEQGRHELRLKLEGCHSQWESQVGELEGDVRELSAQVEQLTRALSEAERDKSRAQLEHIENTQRLQEELKTAMEVERAMSSELQALKQELQQKGSHNRQQDEELMSAMREQVLRLTQKEQVLEQRLESVCQENEELRASLASLHARLALHDQLNKQHSQQFQLAEAWQEVEAARGHSQQLQAQVEELQEEVSLQEARSYGDASLLSELENSLETVGLGVSKEEKNLMEEELVRSKNDMMSLNNQLLEAIQRKLELSQELEAWQDDIQIFINQQLKSQQQLEQPQKKPTSNNSMSFFRRPSRTASTWTRQSSSSSWNSDCDQDKTQSPWRDWLRRGKGAQYSK